MKPPLASLLVFAPLLIAAEAVPSVFMIGDSTMADKPIDLPERGWGMSFGEFFTDPTMIKNHAVNGRSTKSFIAEGRWQKVTDELKKGDFVIIQFGHNDEKTDKPEVGTDAATTFRDNLRRFVAETRGKGASPILATPVCRRKFDAAGKLIPTHGNYPDAVRAVAADEKVPLLDLKNASARWLQAEGDEPTKKYFMWIEAGQVPEIPGGKQDDTHFVARGAAKVAALAAEQICQQKLPLARWLK